MKFLTKLKNLIFPFVVALSALSVSASAAFYSVSGLSKLFAGASLEVLIMATSLEVSKLVIASLLYQYWKDLNKLLRFYLTSAAFILVLITSMGIYGFLSAAYQETATKSGIVDKEINVINLKRERFIENRDYLLEEKKSLDESVNSLRDGLANNMVKYKDPKTGEMVWKGKGPSPKLTPAADLQKLDPSARGLKVGAKSPAVKSLRATLNKMRDEEFSEVPSDAPQDGRSRKNKSGEVELKTIAAELGFKNPNGALQFMNRVLEKFKSRFENYDEVMIASLEIMKEYIDELSSPHKSGSTMQDPLITPQDAELMKQHPEMIKDLQTFRVYLNKKLRERGL